MQQGALAEAIREPAGEESFRPEKNILTVYMLGEFSMFWGEKQICRSIKGKDSQFTRLMEILIYNRGKGVSRRKIEEILFDGKEYANPAQMLCSVVYSAKRKLVKAGLPDEAHILYKDGFYYWNSSVQVKEDVQEFQRLCDLAEKLKDPDEKLHVLAEACQLYKGEFLPFQSNLAWAGRESKRYAELFHSCVQEAAKILRETKNYTEMEKLGRYASRMQPFGEWEEITMEALAGMNRHEEARILYDETAERYMNELGIAVSLQKNGLLEKLGDVSWRYSVLDEIQEDLTGGNKQGGYLCTYPVFQGIYRSVTRMMDREGMSAYLMLCTPVDSKGNYMKEGRILEKLLPQLEQAAVTSVRRSDIVCRYGKSQLLILLINTSREDCGIVEKRINAAFSGSGRRVRIQFNVSAV